MGKVDVQEKTGLVALLDNVIPYMYTATLACQSLKCMFRGRQTAWYQICRVCLPSWCKVRQVVGWLTSFLLLAEVRQHPGCREASSHQGQNETETIPKHLILTLLHSRL